MENKNNTIKVRCDYDDDVDYIWMYAILSKNKGAFIHNAIESKYNILEDQTSDNLPKAVLCLSHLGSNSLILNKNVEYSKIINNSVHIRVLMDLSSFRMYKGKEVGNDTQLLFCLRIGSNYENILNKPTKSIVFLVDGERLEIETLQDTIDIDKFQYDFKEIYGDEPYFLYDKLYLRKILFELNPNDIKRFAEAKNVQVCIDSTKTYDVNGGVFKVDLNGEMFKAGSSEHTNNYRNYQIEGFQGLMKRAYHYFVDESYFGDYCSSYDAIMQKRIEEYEPIIISYREKTRQEKAEEKKAKEEMLLKEIRKTKIIIWVSAALLILGLILKSVLDFWWFGVPALVGLVWGITRKLSGEPISLWEMFKYIFDILASLNGGDGEQNEK